MNKAQIKAELRRSACEDEDPWRECDFYTFGFASDESRETGNILSSNSLSKDDIRTFFLLVAEAL